MATVCGYGTYLPGDLAVVAQFREEVDLVEEAGFDGIYFSEHHGVAGYTAAPLTLAGFVLGRSTVLRSGPLPLLVALHDPVRIAEQAALLDFVSGGRLDLGVAVGYLQADFHQTGIDPKERGARFDEYLSLYRNLWSTHPETFEGLHARLLTSDPLPHGPVTPGGPPLVVAGSGPRAMRRAARLGAGMVFDSLRGQDEIAEMAASFAAICAAYGVPTGPIWVIRRGWFGDERATSEYVERTRADLQRYVSLTEGSNAPWMERFRRDGIAEHDVRERIITGSPDEAGKELGEWCAEVGIDRIVLKLQWGDRDFAQIREQISLSSAFTKALSASSERNPRP